jgi:hypothetical protein
LDLNGHNYNVYPVDAKVFGLGYKEWSIKWWQWFLSIPKEKNPALDTAGENCDINQDESGVWFLAGTAIPGFADRKCVISSKKAIFFPVIASQTSFAEEPRLTSDRELISYVSYDISRWQHLEVIVDGVRLMSPEKYRVRSGPFDITIPSNNSCGLPAGRTVAASDGFWICIKPFQIGNHSLYFSGAEPNFHTEVKYSLTIN